MSDEVKCPEIEPELDVQCELVNGHVGMHRYTATWRTWSTALVGPVTPEDPKEQQ